jgi:hypothetical protein
MIELGPLARMLDDAGHAQNLVPARPATDAPPAPRPPAVSAGASRRLRRHQARRSTKQRGADRPLRRAPGRWRAAPCGD